MPELTYWARRFVTDALGNVTELQYDTLGRKTLMLALDMGTWFFEAHPHWSIICRVNVKPI